MKVFLSAIENPASCFDTIDQKGMDFLWILVSYYYLRGGRAIDLMPKLIARCKGILIDSGAHSFQKGKKVDWEKYTDEYARFIERYDAPNILGYFEMDVDNILGYGEVTRLRGVLEKVSDKIIPVWHKNRGAAEFVRMCEKYAGKIVAVTGFRNEDIKDDQYMMFLREAWRHGCKVHCLGMTRTNILNTIPFDYTDSSSWKQAALYGQVRQFQDGRAKGIRIKGLNTIELVYRNYLEGVAMQKYYHRLWRSVHCD